MSLSATETRELQPQLQLVGSMEVVWLPGAFAADWQRPAEGSVLAGANLSLTFHPSSRLYRIVISVSVFQIPSI
jgi:hypothetical protein